MPVQPFADGLALKPPGRRAAHRRAARAQFINPGWRLAVPDNITLLSLPPYIPELNPMENVWDYLRQNKLCTTVWDTYDDILDACQSTWRFLINDPDRIRSIGTRQWASVSL